MRFLTRRHTIATVLTASALTLAACGDDEANPDNQAEETSAAETSEAEPTFEPKDVSPVIVETGEFSPPAHDPGLNVDFHFQGTSWGDYGGTVVNVAVTNLNEVPLPPSALEGVRLSYDTGSSMEQASLLHTETPEGAPPLQLPLDRPLGPGATTNLHYTFDVSRSLLYDAEFQIGNVIYRGNLVV